MRRSSLLCLLLVSACVSLRGDPPPRISGGYAAKIVLTGRSTYTGSFTGEWVADSLRGSLKLTSPLAVDAALRGSQAGDTLRLRGSYSAANGCTGTIEAAIGVAPGLVGARGPITLTDRCAGALTGTMELTR